MREVDLLAFAAAHASGAMVIDVREPEEYVSGHVPERKDRLDWRASPLRAQSLAGVAPALVVTAGFDPLRDEGEAYGRRLREAGVRIDMVCYGGMIHGFAPMGRLIETGNRAVAHAAASLRQALGLGG